MDAATWTLVLAASSVCCTFAGWVAGAWLHGPDD